MMRSFFHASAAVLMLAIAYQLGVSAAHSQTSGTVADADDPGFGSLVVTTSGRVYVAQYSSQLALAPHWTFRGTIPLSAPIVRVQNAGTDPSGADVAHAFDANGNFFVSADGGRSWVLRANVFGGATPAVRESWGRLKARYR
jgi:hypothetical protein